MHFEVLNRNSATQILFKFNLNTMNKNFETYKKLSLLGEGSFGKAYLVECGSDKVSLI